MVVTSGENSLANGKTSRAIRRGPLLEENNHAHSRLCAVLIDCNTADLDEAARFWAAALGRPVDLGHPMSRDNYPMLETRSDEVSSKSNRSSMRAARTSTLRPTISLPR